jgi:hypothetical protein
MSEPRLTKEQKRQAREVAALAREAELTAALRELEVLFADWRKGRIDAFQLADAIHQFHDGEGRDLFSMYSSLPVEGLAARAIARELVPLEKVPRELRRALGDRIDHWRRRG